ncbi:MAG: hypothetical protein ACR2IK_08235 [Chloroflexota bacterium]
MNEQSNDKPIFASQPLEQVRQGMTVIDADGKQLGSVNRIEMGDPQAVTTAGNEPVNLGGVVLAPAAGVDGGPGALGSPWGSIDAEGLGDVPDVLRQDLRRAGFIQVEGAILKGANRFIPSDRIAEVSGDTVRLQPVSTAAPPAEVAGSSTVTTETPARAEVDSPPVERLVFTTEHDDATSGSAFVPRALVSGGVTAVVLGTAGVAVWLYRRRQQEQARSLNRLRRATAGLRESLGDNPRVPSGAIGSAVLLMMLALARRARRDRQSAQSTESGPTNDWSPPSLRRVLPAMDNLAAVRQQVGSKPSRYGLPGLASVVVVSGGALLVWRRMRSEGPPHVMTPPAEAGTRLYPVQGGQARWPEAQPGTTPAQTGGVKPDTRGVEAQAPITRADIAIESHPVERQPADRPIGQAQHDTSEGSKAATSQGPESRRASSTTPADKPQPEHGGDLQMDRPVL